MGSEAYYITTPIYYASGPPFIGNAYTSIVVDALARFARLEGKDAYSLTGTDEHGPKVEKSAAEAGISPIEWVDNISRSFREMWPTLNIEVSDYLRTTEERHKKVVRQILQKVYDSGDIYLGEKEGLYCVGCEMFYDESELAGTKCPIHETEVEKIREPNYFFRMSNYYDWWREYLGNHPDTIRPERYLNQVLKLLESPTDLSISRPKSRVKWGIDLPFDTDHVAYVWFDALINYVSALGWPDDEKFKNYWPVAEHCIGKDILLQHGVYWPTMLKSAGIPVYRHLNVHGFWQGFDGRKMSKSLGNSINPADVREIYGADPVRYALLREMTFGLDGSIGDSIIAERLNSDLANDLGNLASRIFTLVNRSFGDVVPQAGTVTEKEEALRDQWLEISGSVSEYWHELRLSHCIEAIMVCVRATNRYIDQERPWDLAKGGDTERLGTVLYAGLETLRVVSVLFWPVMPERMGELRKQLGIAETPLLEEALKWGLLKPGSSLIPGENLFPRADIKAAHAREDAKIADLAPDTEQPAEKDIRITFDEFSKVQMQVGTITAAEAVPKADKLLVLQVDLGNDIRQIVAGIAESYEPSNLIGQQVVVVVNLMPAKIRGVKSEGMILAADDGDGLKLIAPEQTVDAGGCVS